MAADDSLNIGGHTVGTRIVTDPAILGGKPVVRGTRISVEHILELIASGATVDDIARTYPALVKEDVIAAVQFAAQYLRRSYPGSNSRLPVETG